MGYIVHQRTLFDRPDILVFPNISQIKFLNFGSLWYRAKEEKRLAAARDIEFSPQELALATVPGMNFDPRDCRFSPEELRPQPIIRKRKKVLLTNIFIIDGNNNYALMRLHLIEVWVQPKSK